MRYTEGLKEDETLEYLGSVLFRFDDQELKEKYRIKSLNRVKSD